MKKFYALVLSILAVMMLGNIPTAHAQGTFTAADYIVRKVPNVWNELDEGTGATRIASLDHTGWFTPYNYGYIPVSEEITVPFTFLFANIPDAQTVKVWGEGTVQIGSRAGGAAAVPQTSPSNTRNNYYSNFGYTYYYPGSGTSDSYYPNYLMSPWGGSYTTYIPKSEEDNGGEVGSTSFTYQTLGTAPNRSFVIQAKNLASWVEYGVVYFGNGGARKQGSIASWQTVIYEGTSVPSKIRFYYKEVQGPCNNWTLDLGTAFGGGFGSGYNYSYRMICGIKAAGNYGGANSFLEINNGASRGLANGTLLTVNTHYTRTDPSYYSTQGPYDVESTEIPTTSTYEFAIYYKTNLAWTNPNFNPADNTLKAINVAFTPSATLTNEGQNQIQTATVSVSITQIGVGVVYSNSTTITPNGDTRLPAPYGGIGTAVTFPNYTPTSYGLYTTTWTISGVQSSPGLATEDYLADNVATVSWTCSPPNNLASVGMIAPTNASRIPLNIGIPITWRFRNSGANDQAVGRVSLVIKNPSGNVVYRDTIVIVNFTSNTYQNVTFKDFTATQKGIYTLCGITLLSNDQLPLDDTSCATLDARYEADVKAISVFDPDDDSEKPEGKGFQPIGVFQNVGVRDLFDIKTRVIIRRCADNVVVFQADSNPGIPELNIDQGQVKFSFPSKQGAFDTKNIAAGCYKLCVIALLPDDGDRTNDTACVFFSVIPKLQGNINVGVGQRFTTIHAAVDSMLYRGIGGNLNLILTDAAYTEDGTDPKVSTPTAAISFAGRLGAFDRGAKFPSLGIEGTGPNAIVTWKPKANVSPVITFTGSAQNCFEIGYRSISWMRWDGNNQRVPSIDQIFAEPAKRQIQIVNNSTTAGTIFALKTGRDHLTFRNLRLKNNGNLNSAASKVIDISNVYDFNSFNAGVRDTTSHNNIAIDNNEIGNAAYGISDVGTIPVFNIGKAVFEDRRNNNNRIIRNTIGSQALPLGNYGVFFGNEDGLLVDRNEISWITGGTSATNAAAIASISGNSINSWINGNKMHNVGGTATTYGVWSLQNSTIYQVGTGIAARKSKLPVNTNNRVTSNFIYDLRNAAPASIFPVWSTTGAANYTVKLDSIFNNSIAVDNSSATITMIRTAMPFIWDNIIQNHNNAANVNAVQYSLTVPRPWATSISSDYNLQRLLASNQFATVSEYDSASGTPIQTTNIKSLNDWRTYTQQDINSILGTATNNKPLFTSDSLHLPGATSYIFSAASNSGAYFSATQAMDIDGDQRLTDNPDMGADEFDGFQWNNDLGVQAILQPAGLTDGNGNIVVTSENPLHIQAIVKNLGGITTLQRNVTAKFEKSTDNGLTWSLVWQSAPQKYDFDVAQSRVIDFTGPNVTVASGNIYRVTVFVDPDQNNSNNSLSKTFKLTLKKQAVVVSYESTTARGLENRDSLTRALRRLGVAYDSIDRASFGSNVIDYTPWWTLIWSMGDPTQTYNNTTAPGTPLGIGAVSLKETEEIVRFLRAGQTWAKKSFIIAGQNIAQYNDPVSPFSALNNPITDLEFMRQWMHTIYKKDQPGWNYPSPGVPTTYRDALKGTGLYFVFADSISALSPDVIYVYPVTGPVGSEITRVAYNYTSHSASPLDSGAGTAFTSPKFNVVFYAFGWAGDLQTVGTRDGEPSSPVNTSGTTRFLRGALDFIQSYKGIVLPVEFLDVSGEAKADGNLISWKAVKAVNLDHYEIEKLDGDTWTFAGKKSASDVNCLDESFDARQVKTFTYRVVGVDLDGSKTTSQTVTFGRTADGITMALEQNFPNPFTTSTKINFSLAENGLVSVRVMDMTGKVIATTINGEEMNAGPHETMFSANNLATGTYIYELTFTNADGKATSITKMMTLKK